MAKAGEYMGGCLNYKTYAESGCACHVRCHFDNNCCDDIDWIRCSCQNVIDMYILFNRNTFCNYGKFQFLWI